MNFLIICCVALLAGIFASMGLGGGMILIIYLTVFLNTDQLIAQGINLMFFIPIALISVIIHAKNKLIIWKIILPTVLCGIVGTLIGEFFAKRLGSKTLSKIFAVFLIIIGVREVIKALNKKENNADSNKA